MKLTDRTFVLCARIAFIVIKLAAVVVMANHASQKFVYGGF